MDHDWMCGGVKDDLESLLDQIVGDLAPGRERVQRLETEMNLRMAVA